jgi:glycosyltransferase involved in cell wall biosynthesis
MPWVELPPGCELHEVEGHSHEGGSLRLLYVGGVTPPVYDLSPLFAVAQSVPEAEVRLVCRREEWRTTRDRYPELPNVRVSHLDANDLPSLYCDADLFALLLEPVSYLGLARPVKLFESLGFGLPILTIGDTLSSRWVAAEGVGWSVRDTSEAVRVVDRLREERAEILAKRKRALEIRAQHSWSRRAEAVVGALVEDGAP